MDELEHEEPDAESYLSDEPNTLEKPTTPPKRKAVFRSVFRAVLAPAVLFMIVLLAYFIVLAATNNQPQSPLRLVMSFLLVLFGAICAVWFAVGLVVLIIKLSLRTKQQGNVKEKPNNAKPSKKR